MNGFFDLEWKVPINWKILLLYADMKNNTGTSERGGRG
jgi:hypothetical protein